MMIRAVMAALLSVAEESNEDPQELDLAGNQ